MQLLYKALERKILVSSVIMKGFASEGFVILLSGGVYTIKHKGQEYSLAKDTHHMSKEYKEFRAILKNFLDVTFPG